MDLFVGEGGARVAAMTKDAKKGRKTTRAARRKDNNNNDDSINHLCRTNDPSVCRCLPLSLLVTV